MPSGIRIRSAHKKHTRLRLASVLVLKEGRFVEAGPTTYLPTYLGCVTADALPAVRREDALPAFVVADIGTKTSWCRLY